MSQNTPVIARRYYPTLGSIVSLNEIPDELDFIKDGIMAVLDNLHYKDLQYSKSPKGDAAFYSFSIVSPNRLEIPVFNSGISLVINPDLDDSQISSFPITIDYEWKVLSYLRAIGNTDFTSAQSMFELALMLLSIRQEDAMQQFLIDFVVPIDASTTPLEQFVNDVNAAYGGSWTNPIPAPTEDTELSEVISHIYQESGEFSSLIGFGVYILDTDPNETLTRVKKFFSSLLPLDIEDHILSVITPSFRATLSVSAGLEFPRNFLTPIYDENGNNPHDQNDTGDPFTVIPEDAFGHPKVMLAFDEAIFYADVVDGLGYNFDPVLNTTVPAFIGNTGFTIDITNLKLDMSSKKNIEEADTDGRDLTFVGVHIDQLEVRLPQSLTPEAGETAVIRGTNLLIGDPGGLSGVLALDGASLRAEIGSLTLELVNFDITFSQNTVINSNIQADLYIPGVKAKGTGTDLLGNSYGVGDPAPIALDISYTAPDYTITVTSNPIPTIDIFGMDFTLHTLSFGFNTDSLNNFIFKGELFIPNFKAEAAGSNEFGAYAQDAPAPIVLETTYTSNPNTFALVASNIPQINVLGLGIEVESIGFDIIGGNFSNFSLNSFLFIPGIKATSSGTYGSQNTSYNEGELAPIGLLANYTDPDWDFSLIGIPILEVFGMEIKIFTLNLGFNGSSVNFLMDSEIRIPNLKVPEGVTGSTGNLTNYSSGELTPIEVSTAYTGGGSDVFTFSTGSQYEFEFFGLGLTIPSLSFDITDGNLGGLSFSSIVRFEQFDTGDIGVDFSYSGSEYSVGMTSLLVTLTLGSVEFDFTSFNITWDGSGITSSNIAGQMRVDGNSIGFIMGFTPEGWKISASDTGGVGFTIPNVLGVTIYELTIGKRNGNLFVEVGKDSNVGTQILGAALENLLTIPLVGKYLPSDLEIGFLSFEAGSGLDLNNAELKLLWPELEGLEISTTSTGLEATIPVNKAIFKTITINTINVSMSNVDVNNDGNDETVLKALMDGAIEIGPIIGSVANIGLEAVISYPAAGGNLGPANIDDFSIAGPDGIGLSIDSGGVKGSGYLSFNKEKGEYTGYLGLTINQKISLNAIAILNTKMPDGSNGISLLIILTAEFNPGIQLGFGFNLTGLGGLLGLNRTMEIEPLRLGVKDGTIDHILFPDPTTFIQNAPTHISNIQSIFPVDQGRFVFGPMAKIGWGTPTLITAEVGLLLEVPKPIRLAILGVIKAVLPDEDNDLIRLQINFLGLIDFGKKFISFDATIFDSKILTFAVSGDMAFRLHYGDNPAFLLSVGGFHPSFVSPIPVPTMNRLIVKIVDKEKIRVVLTSYFAVTSNTVQFGAKVDLLARLGAITAQGYFGLDTLFQFSPFYMIASISAGVAISYNDFDLAAIHLSGEIEGPTPWKVRGTATFKIVGIEKSFNMAETFGEERTVTYESVDVQNLLLDALEDDTNWVVTTSRFQDEHVVLKSQQGVSNIISSDGDLTITQRVLPLNYSIEKYGNRVPSGARTFSIASVAFGPGATELADLEDLKEDFATAEFKNIDKSKKLSIPSFEKMDGGVKVNPPAGGLDFGGDSASAAAVQRDALYEKTLVDYVPDPMDPLNEIIGKVSSSYQLQETWMQREVRGGAAARAKASRTRSKLYGKTDQRVSITEETFAVVSTEDLSTTHTAKSRLEAEALMEAEIIADPTLEGKLQVITNHRV